ncbi:unnamed protein product [Phytophthora lilii]|uniref:Unnamed protein product n=1 Tax=Phytophthora lilii TaxID=2077276 RepID=A0A9W6U378_9STRA|nr:unnamed protein product [Phytophthora lilii]
MATAPVAPLQVVTRTKKDIPACKLQCCNEAPKVDQVRREVSLPGWHRDLVEQPRDGWSTRESNQNLSAEERVSPRARVRLLYSDEDLLARYCANSLRLLKVALKDSEVQSTDARLVLRALRYRNVLDRIEGADPHDPAFDESSFFGVEWRKGTLADAK